MKSVFLGLFAIFAMNFGATGTKSKVSDSVLKNVGALQVEGTRDLCSACEASPDRNCYIITLEDGGWAITSCMGNNIEEV